MILRAEGVDESGRIVSRARAYFTGGVPPRGSAPFEIRLVPSGSEPQYRVSVESFEFVEPRGVPAARPSAGHALLGYHCPALKS